MSGFGFCRFVPAALSLCGILAAAEEIKIALIGSGAVSRQTIEYQCDAAAAKMGLPTKPFGVEYINGGGNSLAIVPVGGQSIVFANVVSASGARYVGRQYTWWEKGGQSATFSSDHPGEKMQSTCSRVKQKERSR